MDCAFIGGADAEYEAYHVFISRRGVANRM